VALLGVVLQARPVFVVMPVLPGSLLLTAMAAGFSRVGGLSFRDVGLLPACQQSPGGGAGFILGSVRFDCCESRVAMAEESLGDISFLVEVTGKGGGAFGVASIPVETLRANFREATQMLSEALGDIHNVGTFELQEVEVGVEVSAEGGVQFVGTAKVAGSGSIKLKFTKSESR
jgi:hypothetical protein